MPTAVLSEPQALGHTFNEMGEGLDEEERFDPLASRCFCASASCSLNVFCRLLNVSCCSGSMSAKEGVRLEESEAVVLEVKPRTPRRTRAAQGEALRQHPGGRVSDGQSG